MYSFNVLSLSNLLFSDVTGALPSATISSGSKFGIYKTVKCGPRSKRFCLVSGPGKKEERTFQFWPREK